MCAFAWLFTANHILGMNFIIHFQYTFFTSFWAFFYISLRAGYIHHMHFATLLLSTLMTTLHHIILHRMKNTEMATFQRKTERKWRTCHTALHDNMWRTSTDCIALKIKRNECKLQKLKNWSPDKIHKKTHLFCKITHCL